MTSRFYRAAWDKPKTKAFRRDKQSLMFHRTPSVLPLVYPSLVWRIPTSERTVYLTFDDGPVPGPTEMVLETLEKFSIPGTFFCIGENIKKHPGVFKKVLSNGHAIGNHTFNHLNGWKTSTPFYHENVEACTEEIELHASQGTRLFRPPYGRISRRQIKTLSNYHIIMWDVLSFDYNTKLNTEKALRNTITATRPGSIVVFHDSHKAERNLAFLLPRFIESCLERGFRFDLIHL